MTEQFRLPAAGDMPSRDRLPAWRVFGSGPWVLGLTFRTSGAQYAPPSSGRRAAVGVVGGGDAE